MKNQLCIHQDSFTLTGFDGMTDFSIGATSSKIIIFPKLLDGNPLQFLFPARNITDSPDLKEAVRFIREFYGIEEDSFSLDFEVTPGTGNYRCLIVK